jgi:hypothetical protein
MYALVSLPPFALWEVAHAPLYSLWVELGAEAGIKAALHCTLGDAVIAFICALAGLLVAILTPRLRTFGRTSSLIIIFGMLTTVGIELISTQWLGRWAYRDVMPVDPFLGIGLSPLAQWLVVPVISLHLLRRILQDALSSMAIGAIEVA